MREPREQRHREHAPARSPAARTRRRAGTAPWRTAPCWRTAWRLRQRTACRDGRAELSGNVIAHRSRRRPTIREQSVPCRIARLVRRDDIQFPAKHSALRDDVHVLGALVGDVLKEQGGDALFDLVEKDRRLSIRRRAGDKEAAAELSVQLRGRAPQVARDLARAFSMWFRAVNLAEKVHRIRRRRGYFLEASERAQPGGVEAALTELKSRGLTLAEVLELLQQDPHRAGVHGASHRKRAPHDAAQEPAHRGACCSTGSIPTLTPQELRHNWSRVRTEITTAWQTEDHPRERLTVADEREHVVFYLAEILYRILPAFYDELAEALAKLYGVHAGFARAAEHRALRHLGGRRHGRQSRRARQDHSRNAGAPAAGHHQRVLQRVPAPRAAAVAEREPQRGHAGAHAAHRVVRHADSRRAGHHADAPRSHAVSRVPRADRRAAAPHLRRPAEWLRRSAAVPARPQAHRHQPQGQPRLSRRLGTTCSD